MLTIHDVEIQARQAIARAKAGKQSESSIVELKSVWTPKNDFGKTARRIAALANAAHGQPVIWVVGVDERNGIVVGADEMELANWWPQIRSKFDSVAPTMLHNAPFEIDGHTVVALCFDTTRPPYVVNCTGGVDREIPWREGNSTRSAFRHEVLQMLKPLIELPEIEVHEAEFVLGPVHDKPKEYAVATRLSLYFDVPNDRRFHILRNRCSMTATFPNTKFSDVIFDKWNFRDRTNSQVVFDGTQITIDGPGTIVLELNGLLPFSPSVPHEVDLQIRFEFNEARGNTRILHIYFTEPTTDKSARYEEIAGRMLLKQIHWKFQPNE